MKKVKVGKYKLLFFSLLFRCLRNAYVCLAQSGIRVYWVKSFVERQKLVLK